MAKISYGLLESLSKAHSAYEAKIGNIHKTLAPSILFDDFSIFYQASDGFVLEWEANNAPLRSCLQIILEKGTLSMEDYMRITI